MTNPTQDALKGVKNKTKGVEMVSESEVQGDVKEMTDKEPDQTKKGGISPRAATNSNQQSKRLNQP